MNEISKFNQALTVDQYKHSLRLGIEQAEAGMLYDGIPEGEMDTSSRKPRGEPYGIAELRPGLDRFSDLSDNNTAANERPMVRRRQGESAPEDLFVIASTGPRQPVGAISLRFLTRLTLAATLIDGQQRGALLHTAYVSSGHRSAELGFYGRPASAWESLALFDRFSNNSNSKGNYPAGGLSQKLGHIVNGQLPLDPETSSVTVISDFIEGASWKEGNDLTEKKKRWRKKEEDKEIDGFNWENNLKLLHNQLGNRLKIVRLFTPSFIDPPFSAKYKGENGIVNLERGEWQEFAKTARQDGEAKQRYISNVLFRMNAITLSTTDTDKVLIKETRGLLGKR